MVASKTIYVQDHHDDGSGEEFLSPLFLVPFYPLSEKGSTKSKDGQVDILSYGGDDGTITLLSPSHPPRIVRKFDDCVRALAVSPDGLFVAVGFDDGTTKIYSYREGKGEHHPFIELDDDGGIFSQGLEEDEVKMDGPRFTASIRDMQFDPRSSPKLGYHLAIVSESGTPSFMIVDVSSKESMKKQWLADESEVQHAGGGVRSVGYSEQMVEDDRVFVSTLGMDGKLVVWDVSGKDPELDWEACHKDYHAVVPKGEPGEGLGSDASDRGSKVLWGMIGPNSGSRVTCLALPGKMDVQYRIVPLGCTNVTDCQEFLRKQEFLINEDKGKGHIETIVSLAFQPLSNFNMNTRRLVTGGKDGKLLLWELTTGSSTCRGKFVAELKIDRSDFSKVSSITSILWLQMEEDVLYAAHADGHVSVITSKRGSNAGVLTAPTMVNEHGSTKLDVEHEIEEGSEEVEFEDSGPVSQPPDVRVDIKEMEKSTLSKRARIQRKTTSTDDDEDIIFDDVQSRLDVETTRQIPRSPSKERFQDPKAFIDEEAADNLEEETKTGSSAKMTLNKETSEDDNRDDSADADVDFADHHDPLEVDPEPGDQDTIDDTGAYENSITNLLQPAFAPSSTPMDEPRRILCWNHIGVVTIRADDMDSKLNIVDIAFHENAGLADGKRPISFTDNMGFIVGTLGEEGGLFASDLMEDDVEELELTDLGVVSDLTRNAIKRSKNSKNSSGGSSVYFHRYETFGKTADKDWVFGLPYGERALGCASGVGWSAVITSRRLLRLFTTGGVQGPVIWIPGEPVTVVGRHRFAGVIYHRSSTPMQDGTQLLSYSIIDGLRGTTVCTGELSAISPGASLTWAGFTDLFAFSIMDSDGMLSMLSRSSASSLSRSVGDWVPILDTEGFKKTTSDRYWPVEVFGGKLICVPLRGGKEHPDAVRRPVTTTLSLRIPMATGLSATNGPLEEVSMRCNIALNQKKILNDFLIAESEGNSDALEEEYTHLSAQVDKVTLKLFMQIINAGKVERGLDLIQRFHFEKSYDIAIQAADRVGLRKLSDRIEEAKLVKFPPLSEENLEESDSVASQIPEANSFEEEPVITTRQQRMEKSQHISPDFPQTPQAKRRREVEERQDRHYETEEESPPRETVRRKIETTLPPTSTKRVNPFAKKRLESPAKGQMALISSPTKLALSRNSTFSTKSRQRLRDGKQIV